MDLKELRQKGGFVPLHPVKKTVQWKSPTAGDLSFEVHIKRLPFGEWERLITTSDGEGKRSRTALLLSSCVFLGDKGDQPLSYKDAYQLEPSLAAVLLEAVNEVNIPKA